MKTMAYNIDIATEVRGKLSALRRHLRGRLLGEGLAWVLVALVAAVFATFGIDYVLKLDRPYRVAMVCAALGIVAWIVWRHVLGPMLAPMKPEDLALLVERRHRQLGDRLISALQFARAPGAGPNVSPAMVAETVRQANAMAAPLEVDGIVERRNLRRVLAIGVCTVGLLAGFSVWQHRLMWPWLQRNVAFADVDYPQDTYLEVKGGPEFTILRGTDLTVVIRTEDRSTVAPPHVTVHAHFPSQEKGDDDGWREGQADLKGKDDEGRDHYTLTFERVTEEFSFYVTGGDDRRVRRRDQDKHHYVRLIDPPALAGVSFTGKFPDYLSHEQHRRDDTVSDLLGTVSIPAGTTLSVSATATKDLREAKILLNGQPVPDSQVRRPGLRTILWTRTFDVPRRAAPPAATRGRGPRGVEFELAFQLRDTDGYSNVCGQKKIDVRLDQPPTVKSTKRITILGDIATPAAIIPLTSEFSDDHNVLIARASVSAAGKTTEQPPPHVPFREPGEKKAIVKRTKGHEVDLRPYGFVPDDEVIIEVLAEDSLPKSLGGPNIGRSTPLAVKIVTPGKVQEKLSETAGRVRDEFNQTIALQQSVRDGVRACGLMLAGGKTADVVAPKLALLAGRQAAVGPECKKTADAVGDILEARIYNRLDSEEYYQNVRRKIIDPLAGLAEPLAETALAVKRASGVKDRNRLQEQIIAITEAQDAILKVMGGVKDEMDSEGTRRDIINSCMRIIDWSKEQLQNIKKRSDAEAGSVFDKKKDDKKGKTDDKPAGGR